MDIKNALNAILPLNLRAKDRVEKAIKSESATDRDANGQQAYNQQNEQDNHGPMTDEQFAKALEHLKNLAVVKDNNLSVVPTVVDGKKFVLIKEPDGKVVRKIAENELWSLQVVRESKKGQLLRRTA